MARRSARSRNSYGELRIDEVSPTEKRYGVPLRRVETQNVINPNVENFDNKQKNNTNGMDIRSQDINASVAPLATNTSNDLSFKPIVDGTTYNVKKINDDENPLGLIDSNKLLKAFGISKKLLDKGIEAIINHDKKSLTQLKYTINDNDKSTTYYTPEVIGLVENLLNRTTDWLTIKEISIELKLGYKKTESYIKSIINETGKIQSAVFMTERGNIYHAYKKDILILVQNKLRSNKPPENFILQSEFIKNSNISEYNTIKYREEWQNKNLGPNQIVISNRKVYFGPEIIKYIEQKSHPNTYIPEGFVTIKDIEKILKLDKIKLYYYIETILRSDAAQTKALVLETTLRNNQKLYNIKLIDLIKERVKYSINKPPENWVSLRTIGKMLSTNTTRESFRSLIDNIIAVNGIKYGTYNLGSREHIYYEPRILGIIKNHVQKEIDVNNYLSISEILSISCNSNTKLKLRKDIRNFIYDSGKIHGTERIYKKNNNTYYHINVLRDVAQYVLDKRYESGNLNDWTFTAAICRYIRANIYYVEKINSNLSISNKDLIEKLYTQLQPFFDKINQMKKENPIVAEKTIQALANSVKTNPHLRTITRWVCQRYLNTGNSKLHGNIPEYITELLYNTYISGNPDTWHVHDYIFANILAGVSHEPLEKLINKCTERYEKINWFRNIKRSY